MKDGRENLTEREVLLFLPQVALRRFKFRSSSSSEGDFAVAVCAVKEVGTNCDGISAGCEITVCGKFPASVKVGDELSLKVVEEQHAVYGTQYLMREWKRSLPTDEDGLRKYLVKGFTGIGDKRGRALLAEFGMEILQVLDQPEEVAIREIGDRLQWSPETVGKFVRQWHRTVLPETIEFLLFASGFSPKQVASVKDTFGEDGFLSIVCEHPYRLTKIPGIGFLTADRVARRQGLPSDSRERIIAGLGHILCEAEKSGDCFLPSPEAVLRCAKFLKLPPAVVKNSLEQTTWSGSAPQITLDEHGNFWLTEIYEAEQLAAVHVCRRLSQKKSEFPLLVSEYEWRRFQTAFQITAGIILTAEQENAVRLALREPLSIITGNPGTGKTTILKALLEGLESSGLSNIKLCAPTGKAARRMSETCGREALTIHRLLSIGNADNKVTGDLSDQGKHPFSSFSYANPLLAEVVIVDEMSMLDIKLFAHLISGIAPTAKIVLVGDRDQLSSIGAGRVLADLLEAGVPQIRLREPLRQASRSFIVRLAYAVNRGQLMPSLLPPPDSPENVWFQPVRSEEEALTELPRILEKVTAGGQIPTDRVKVIVPQKKGKCGSFALNKLLQAIFNPPHPHKREIVWKNELCLREDDVLMQMHNDRQTDLMNGEEVRLKEFSQSNDSMTAVLTTESGCLIELLVSEMDMQHAYALTIHKSQGSEWDAVILLCLPGQMGFYSRRMFYTALTRAKKRAVIIGDRGSLEKVVARDFETRRRTALTVRIRGGTA